MKLQPPLAQHCVSKCPFSSGCRPLGARWRRARGYSTFTHCVEPCERNSCRCHISMSCHTAVVAHEPGPEISMTAVPLASAATRRPHQCKKGARSCYYGRWPRFFCPAAAACVRDPHNGWLPTSALAPPVCSLTSRVNPLCPPPAPWAALHPPPPDHPTKHSPAARATRHASNCGTWLAGAASSQRPALLSPATHAAAQRLTCQWPRPPWAACLQGVASTGRSRIVAKAEAQGCNGSGTAMGQTPHAKGTQFCSVCEVR